MRTTVLLARHGETDWNRERRFQGHADPPLNELGREQARALGEELAGSPLAAVYSSDLRRAAETARIVAALRGLEPDERRDLREIDVGEWSGLTFAEIERLYPEGVARHVAGGDGWEHGEPHAAMQERIVAAVRRIAADHPGEHILLVIHGGTMRALLAAAEGVDFGEFRQTHGGVENGSVVSIAVEDGVLTRPDAPLAHLDWAAVEDYTNKYKGEQVEVALFGGDYQDGVLTAYCYVEDVAHIELNGHILIPLQNIASLHCSSRCDAPEPDWPPRGLAEDERDDEA